MEQRKVNPWMWQDQYGFSQAIEVSGAERVLYCAGQTSTGEDGNTVAAGDMRFSSSESLPAWLGADTAWVPRETRNGGRARSQGAP